MVSSQRTFFDSFNKEAREHEKPQLHVFVMRGPCKYSSFGTRVAAPALSLTSVGRYAGDPRYDEFREVLVGYRRKFVQVQGQRLS